MKVLFLPILLLLCFSAYAESSDIVEEYQQISIVQIVRLYEEQSIIDINVLVDVLRKEAKIDNCIDEYKKKQSKSYSKIVQHNLYDLIHNFDKISSKIYGKKAAPDGISYEDKIEALGRVQCEAYYTLGVLK